MAVVKTLNICISGSVPLALEQVALYRWHDVAAMANLRAVADQKTMSGMTGNATVARTLPSSAEIVASTARQFEALSSGMQWFPISEIKNIDSLLLVRWEAVRGEEEEPFDLHSIPKTQRDAFLEANCKTRQDVSENGIVLLPRPAHYVHSGDEFVIARDSEKKIALKWTAVTASWLS